MTIIAGYSVDCCMRAHGYGTADGKEGLGIMVSVKGNSTHFDDELVASANFSR
ncbi:MAG TPA: hypothetical protein VJT71_02665 [Pyrinomonadaceae bacterium]|nr:hypothetical protein [Pyrinomonadaceae bacterium]